MPLVFALPQSGLQVSGLVNPTAVVVGKLDNEPAGSSNGPGLLRLGSPRRVELHMNSEIQQRYMCKQKVDVLRLLCPLGTSTRTHEVLGYDKAERSLSAAAYEVFSEEDYVGRPHTA